MMHLHHFGEQLWLEKSVTQCNGQLSDWPSALSRLSNLLIDLYRLAPSVAGAAFQEQALAAAAATLGFDSAIWAAGTNGPEGPIVHTVYAFRQPAEMMQQWEGLKRYDTLTLASLRQPGVTIQATADGPEGGPPFVPEISAHAHRYGMEHVLGTIILSPILGLMEGFSFYRADASRRYTEVERLFVQSLVPHLSEVWSINRLTAVDTERRQAPRSISALALCDRTGRLHAAGAQFADLLRTEWPDWQGPNLPAELLTRTQRKLVGSRIVLAAEPMNDIWQVRVRLRSPADGLSQREIGVARKFAHGMTYQEIARTLNLSPATVRNHLKNIYAKLAIGNKAALANLLRRTEETR